MLHLFHDLQAATEHRTFRSEAGLDVFLREQFPRATPEEKIAMKHYLASTGQFSPGGRHLSAALATDQVRDDRLATDDPAAQYRLAVAPVGREMQTMLHKAGLGVDRSYSQAELDDALQGSPLDATEKIAVRHELAMRRLVRG